MPSPRPGGDHPTRLTIAPDAFVAPGAVIVGEVSIGAASTVWYGSVLRGDIEPVRIGSRSNVQDLCVIHVDEGYPAVIGDRVTIGHRAVVHGAVLEDDCLIGMGAVVLSGATVRRGAVVAAGAVVREGFEVPSGTVCAGVPGRIIGEVDEATARRVAEGVERYVRYGRLYREGRLGGGPYGGA
ncbi:MAG: gamma carbonic anhydrase family protein [Acidobacteria bacterium]|nr:MAG: gamma carbonic anhydrase family protein [Acidobacteriota bacterium]